MPGPQAGAGSAAVADWWLVNVPEVDEENEAAAAPAMTTAKAKIRMASFMIGYPFAITVDKLSQFLTPPC
jgi:hypothetical protein